MKKQHPNILVVSRVNFLVDNGSEAQTVKSFLESYPQENVYQIVCKDFNAGKTGKQNDKFFLVGHSNLRVVSSLISGDRYDDGVAAIGPGSGNKTFNLKRVIRQFAIDLYSLFVYNKSRPLIDFVQSAKPDVIYTIFTTYRELNLIRYISQKFNVPVIPHFLDDWPNSCYSSPLSNIIIRPFYQRAIKKLVKRAPAFFCISDYMCEAFRIRYGNDKAYTLLNSVGKYHSASNQEMGSNLSLLYAGSLYLNRGDVLLSLCEQLQKHYHKHATLSICAPTSHWAAYKEAFSKYSFVKYEGFLNKSDLELKTNHSDVLVFVESFSYELLKFSRYSLSTRIPEYLASGKTVLAMGNREQGSIKYLMENNAAIVAVQLNDLSGALVKLFKEEERKIVLENARNLFFKRHYQPTQQSFFKNVISNCCNQ